MSERKKRVDPSVSKVEELKRKCRKEMCAKCSEKITPYFQEIKKVIELKEERHLKNKNFFFDSYTKLRETNKKLVRNENSQEEFIVELQEENKQLQKANFEFNRCQEALQQSVFEKNEEIDELKYKIEQMKKQKFSNILKSISLSLNEKFPSFLKEIFEESVKNYHETESKRLRSLHIEKKKGEERSLSPLHMDPQ